MRARESAPAPAAADSAPFVTATQEQEIMSSIMVVDEQMALPTSDDADWADFSRDYNSPGTYGADTSISPAAPAPRMIIRASDIWLSTPDFHETVAGVEAIIENRGGFIEYSSMNYEWLDIHCCTQMTWRGWFTLRVPVGLFDQVNRELTTLARVSIMNTTSEDVTLEFQDLGSRLRIREEELRRVEYMLETAEELHDILNLEGRVTNIRMAVDAYRRRMTEIDQLASFSTITLGITEYVPDYYCEVRSEEDDEYYPLYEGDSFITRMGEAFTASVDFMTSAIMAIAVFLAYAGIPIVIIGIILYVLYRVNKRVGFVRLKPR